MRRAATREIRHGRVELHFCRFDCRLFRRRKRRAHERHAEGFYPERAARFLREPRLPVDAVVTELRFLRNRPGAFGDALLVEAELNRRFLTAAEMLDLEALRQTVGGCETESRTCRHPCN